MDISIELPELQPLTITHLAKSPENSAMSAMAVAQVKVLRRSTCAPRAQVKTLVSNLIVICFNSCIQVKESLNMSNAVSPTKITARVQAETLPKSLEASLCNAHIAKLKQLKYDQAKTVRTQKALELIASMQQKLEELEQED